MSISPQSRRVVVTGLGLITCLGVGTRHVWGKLIRGECGLKRLTDKEYEKLPCKIGGSVPLGSEPGLLNLETLPKGALREMSMATVYSIVAADEALATSGWVSQNEEQQYRSGVAIGMGMIDLEEVTDTGTTLRERGFKRISPFFVPKILINMAAGHVSIKHKLKGPNHSVSTACTTGLHAIGDASRFISHGDADVMVAGSADACVGPTAIAGFARMRALSTRDDPCKASRPFDKDRDGFIMAEGAGIVVLEELEHASARGAHIIAEVLGYGLSADASHITTPSEDGSGAERCMVAALKDAGLTPGDIGYVNAHATSTPLGDAAEVRAISKVFKGHTDNVLVSSTKGAVGHLLGGAGSVEAVFTILACVEGVVPPTLNFTGTDFDCDLNIVANDRVTWERNGRKRVALTNSFGFGGTNGSLCIAEFVP